MGTHPIFESDFDCLTEKNLSARKCLNRKKNMKLTRLSTTKLRTEKKCISSDGRDLPLATIFGNQSQILNVLITLKNMNVSKKKRNAKKRPTMSKMNRRQK